MESRPISSTPTQVREQVIGDFLEYQIECPVTIRRNQSALVPLVLREFDGKSVLYYNREIRRQNPMSAVLFKNTTGLTLEGGPVTVLQENSYVGEAMLETIKPTEERLVPYAVELSVRVFDNLESFQDQVHRIIIRNGLMTTHRNQVQLTTYTLNNKSDGEFVVYLDHSRTDNAAPNARWELSETAEPHETTESFWRFRFALPAKKVSTFVVKQRHTTQHSHNLSDTTGNTMGIWLEQRYFDTRTADVLRQVVQQREEEGRLKEQIQQLEKERADIFAAQQRIRENLQALGDRSAEKELRERFVKTLNAQEDRLEVIEKEIKDKDAARNKCRDRIKALLAKLEYDAPVGK
jgi:hypothetical protein